MGISQVGLVIFLIGSALSTGSQNIAMMLAGRGIAGVGAAALLTVGASIRSLGTCEMISYPQCR